MNLWDWLILALAAGAVLGAVLAIRRRRRTGKHSCGCDCGSCPGCAAQKNHNREDPV